MNRILRKYSITLLSLISLIFLTGCMSTSNTTHYKSSIPVQSLPEKGEVLEFRISTGAGGGFAKFARFIIGIIVQGSYYDQPVIPVSAACGGIAGSMQDLINWYDDENTVLLGSNSVITVQLHQDLPFSYRDLTPVYILAIDDFILWVRSDSPWDSARDFIAEARERSIKTGGTGSRLEDEIVFRLVEKAAGTKTFTFIPMKGGGATAQALFKGKLKATVNQLSEIGDDYPEKVRPLCVFRNESLELFDGKVVPSCTDEGIEVNYERFRAIFAPPGIPDALKAKLVKLFEDVTTDENWVDFADKAGLRQPMTGDEMTTYLDNMERLHIDLFRDQGWLR